MSENTERGVLAALSDALANAAENAGASVVAIHGRRRIPSSGVHWRPGIIVTAQHTLERDHGLHVTIADGTTVDAELAGRDPGTDLAVLRADVSAPVAAHDAADLRVGRLVLALGRPGASLTAGLGVISAVGGEYRTWHGGRIDRLVRLDISIQDGFSGGPLVDAGGRVLGINTSALSRRGAITIPASTVDRIAAVLLDRGRVARGYLGVGLQPVRLTEAMRRRAGAQADTGLLVTHVDPGGPADRAGVLLGDLVTAVDGQAVRDLRDVAAQLGPESVGRRMTFSLIRGGVLQQLAIEVSERAGAQESGE